MANKLITIFDKIINMILTIFFILVIFLGLYSVYDLYKVNNSAQLSSDIISLRPEDNTTNYSLDELQKINKDILAWIRIYDTTIDYPVVQGTDNTEYLDQNYKREYSIAGSIFLDYRNNLKFTDDYSIIYGHNMKTGMMFSNIKKYENPEFFNNHLDGILYTLEGSYKIDVICVSKVNAYENIVFNVTSYRNNKNNELLNYFSRKYLFKRDLDLDENSKLILLSTCDEASLNEREVLLAKITKIENDSNSIINSKSLDEKSSESKSLRKKAIDEKPKLNLSKRDIALLILLIIVIIIFIIAIVQKKYYAQKR